MTFRKCLKVAVLRLIALPLYIVLISALIAAETTLIMMLPFMLFVDAKFQFEAWLFAYCILATLTIFGEVGLWPEIWQEIKKIVTSWLSQ